MRIEIPEYSYTDTEIAVVSENENMSNLNAEWYINDKTVSDLCSRNACEYRRYG